LANPSQPGDIILAASSATGGLRRPLAEVNPVGLADSIFAVLFVAYIVALIVLPTGNVFGVNVKILLFLALISPALEYCLRREPGSLAWLIAIPAVFSLWVLLGVLNSFSLSMALTQYKDLITTIAGSWLIALYIADNGERAIGFLRLVVYCVVATSTAKLAIMYYSFTHGVSVVEIMQGISKTFGVELVTQDLGDFGGRIELISDGLIPLCLFAIVALRTELGLRRTTMLLLLAVFIFSAALSFSRYLWVFSAGALCMGLVSARKEPIHLVLLSVLAVAIASFYELLYNMIAMRFTDSSTDSSDFARIEQKSALTTFFQDAPVFGHGLGSFTTEVIRSQTLPYSYENQLLALAGQLGIVGLLLLSVLLLAYYHKLVATPHQSLVYKGSIVALLVGWILGGLLNPGLISSTAAVSYGFLWALGELRRSPQRPPHSRADAI
jgi:O-Antigen ligase